MWDAQTSPTLAGPRASEWFGIDVYPGPRVDAVITAGEPWPGRMERPTWCSVPPCCKRWPTWTI